MKLIVIYVLLKVVVGLERDWNIGNVTGMIIDMRGSTVTYHKEEVEEPRLVLSVNVFDASSDMKRKVNTYVFGAAKDLLETDNGDLMKDKRNVLYFSNSKASVYYDEKEESWCEFKPEDPDEVATLWPLKNMIPVTLCMDGTKGSGGSILKDYSLSTSIALSLSYSLGIYPIVATSTSFGISVTKSISYTGSFSCDVPEGMTGQLFIRPFIYEIPAATKRLVIFDKVEGLTTKNDKMLKYQNVKLIANVKPNHICIVEEIPDQLQCGTSFNTVTIGCDEELI